MDFPRWFEPYSGDVISKELVLELVMEFGISEIVCQH